MWLANYIDGGRREVDSSSSERGLFPLQTYKHYLALSLYSLLNANASKVTPSLPLHSVSSILATLLQPRTRARQ